MSGFVLTVSTPDGNLFNDEVAGLYLRGALGDLAILPGHIPFMTTVKPGKCKIELLDGTFKTGTVNGGLLTVSQKNTTLASGTFKWSE